MTVNSLARVEETVQTCQAMRNVRAARRAVPGTSGRGWWLGKRQEGVVRNCGDSPHSAEVPVRTEWAWAN